MGGGWMLTPAHDTGAEGPTAPITADPGARTARIALAEATGPSYVPPGIPPNQPRGRRRSDMDTVVVLVPTEPRCADRSRPAISVRPGSPRTGRGWADRDADRIPLLARCRHASSAPSSTAGCRSPRRATCTPPPSRHGRRCAAGRPSAAPRHPAAPDTGPYG